MAGEAKPRAEDKTGDCMPIPLALQGVRVAAADIRVEPRRDATTMTVTRPAPAVADFAESTRKVQQQQVDRI